MIKPPLPDRDAERVAVLRSLGVLDTPPEPDLDELTQLAAQICSVPIALISLIDEDRQWFKSRVGLNSTSTPRDQSFCAHAIARPGADIFIVPDAHQDPRFVDNPLVRLDPNVRFYAGAPLITSDGWGLGTLCVIDRQPRELTPAQLRALSTLRRHVTNALEMRRLLESQKKTILDLEQARHAVDEARRNAEEATRAKADFLAAMSHEIRTPMNAVIGMTTLLRSTALSPEQRESVDLIQMSGDHLLGVINDILDFSKIEADRLTIEYAPFSVTECVAAAVQLVMARAQEKRLGLRTEFASPPPALLAGDATRLRQILVNLLSNAVKFTDQGEVVVRIEWSPLPAGGAELRFTVRDTGIGIPPDRMDRLFQRFSQVDTSTTRRYGGTGLGLAISRRLAELHGGAMAAASALGKGSSFTFTIKTQAAGAALPANGNAPAPVGFDPDFACKHPTKILIAEDNPINQRVLARLLGKLGFEPAIVNNGAEALAAMRASVPDVVLMDVEMPVLDGLAATRALRAEFPPGRQPAVIAVTAHAVAGVRDEYLQAGMDECLTKPIRLDELMDVLSRWPEFRKQRAASSL
jgi:signal transduction histidine kinase/ActR/RegA family two-component response regulator